MIATLFIICVVLGSSIAAIHYKVGKHFDELEAQKETKAIEPAYMCPVFEIRMTQQKMVDAGIIEQWELSACESKECDDCYVDGPSRMRALRYREPRKPNSEIAIKKPFYKSETGRPQKKRCGDYMVSIPPGIPDHAVPVQYNYNPNGGCHEFLWKWITEEGTTRASKSIELRPEVYVKNRCTCEQCEIMSGDGEIIALTTEADESCPEHGVKKSYLTYKEQLSALKSELSDIYDNDINVTNGNVEVSIDMAKRIKGIQAEMRRISAKAAEAEKVQDLLGKAGRSGFRPKGTSTGDLGAS